MKRHRIVPVSIPSLRRLLVDGSCHFVDSGLPESSVIVEIIDDGLFDAFKLVVEDPSFEEIADDAEPPLMDVCFSTAPKRSLSG